MRGWNNTTRRNPIFHLPEELLDGFEVSTFDHELFSNNTAAERIFFKILEIVEITEITIALAFNISLFILIVNQVKLRRKKSSKFFINLQIVHFFLLTSNVVQKVHSQYNAFQIYVNNGLLMELFISMFLSTMDRLITIKHPYRYERIKVSQIVVIILNSWLPGMAFIAGSIVTKTSQESMSAISIVLIGLAMIVLITSNLLIHIIAKRHWIVIRQQSLPKSIDRKTPIEKKRLKSTYVCLAIVISFLVFWLPYFIHGILLLTKRDVGKRVTGCVEVLAVANSVFFPLLFVLFRKDVKKELSRLFKKKKPTTESSVRT